MKLSHVVFVDDEETKLLIYSDKIIVNKNGVTLTMTKKEFTDIVHTYIHACRNILYEPTEIEGLM